MRGLKDAAFASIQESDRSVRSEVKKIRRGDILTSLGLHFLRHISVLRSLLT